MKQLSAPHLHKYTALLTLLAAVIVLCGCTAHTDSDAATTDSAIVSIPETAAPATPDTPPAVESYPFSVMLEDGSEIEISLPCDPEQWAELHVCALSDTETHARVVLYNIAHGTELSLEEARVFSGDNGTEYPVVSPNEILSRYVTIYDETDAWRMAVGGADYEISKSQFSDYPADQILTTPDPTLQQNFFVENGQLFCRVSFLCAGNGTGFAAETLKIRYDLTDGTLTAAEITFERAEIPQTEEIEETP